MPLETLSSIIISCLLQLKSELGKEKLKRKPLTGPPQCFHVLPLLFQGTAMEKEGKEVRNRGGPACRQLQASMGSSRPGRSNLSLLFSIEHDCYSSGATSSLSLLLSIPTHILICDICLLPFTWFQPSFLPQPLEYFLFCLPVCREHPTTTLLCKALS